MAAAASRSSCRYTVLHVLTPESRVKAARMTKPNSQMPARGSGVLACAPDRRGGPRSIEEPEPDDAGGAGQQRGEEQRRARPAARRAEPPATASAPTMAAPVPAAK